jgi:hypothetical protein
MTHALRKHISPGHLLLVVAAVLAALALALVFLGRPAAAKTNTAPTASDQGCSARTLHGSYGGTVSGASAATGPLGSLIQLTFNGNGIGTGKITFMTETTGPLSFPSTITYTVNSDCSGMLAGATSTGTHHFDIVVTDSGQTFQLLGADQGVVESGTFEHV